MNRAEELARTFALLMQVFAINMSAVDFCKSIKHAIVLPAMELAEKLHISTDRFQFRRCPFDEMKQPHVACVESLEDLDCSDLFQHGKRFDIEKFEVAPTRAELVEDLKYLCNMTPEMSWSFIQGDRMSDPQIVRKAKVLVAWGNPSDFTGSTRNLFAELNAAVSKRTQRPGLISNLKIWR